MLLSKKIQPKWRKLNKCNVKMLTFVPGIDSFVKIIMKEETSLTRQTFNQRTWHRKTSFSAVAETKLCGDRKRAQVRKWKRSDTIILFFYWGFFCLKRPLKSGSVFKTAGNIADDECSKSPLTNRRKKINLSKIELRLSKETSKSADISSVAAARQQISTDGHEDRHKTDVLWPDRRTETLASRC